MGPIHMDALRINARLSQREAAEKLGVDPSTLSAWEQEKRFPGVDKLKSMCVLYGCTMDDIFVPETQT